MDPESSPGSSSCGRLLPRPGHPRPPESRREPEGRSTTCRHCHRRACLALSQGPDRHSGLGRSSPGSATPPGRLSLVARGIASVPSDLAITSCRAPAGTSVKAGRARPCTSSGVVGTGSHHTWRTVHPRCSSRLVVKCSSGASGVYPRPGSTVATRAASPRRTRITTTLAPAPSRTQGNRAHRRKPNRPRRRTDSPGARSVQHGPCQGPDPGRVSPDQVSPLPLLSPGWTGSSP